MRYDGDPDYIPPLLELRGSLLSELARLMNDPAVIRHEKVVAWLEDMATRHILGALRELGWDFKVGQTFSCVDMASKLGIIKRHRLLLERLLMMLEDVAMLRRSDSFWEVISEPPADCMDLHRAAASDKGFESEPEAALVRRCGEALSLILKGELDPLQVLFPDGDSTLLAKFYRESPVLRAMNILMEKLISRAILSLPPGRGFRLLEIGAGTGSTTSYLLPCLPSDQVCYVFTDVSPLFAQKAKQEFSRYHFVEYGTLNIEGDPQRQGYRRHQFDFVVVADVFHATRDLVETLEHTRQLLKPGGLLAILELTSPLRWTDLVFGLTQGWWRFIDTDLRPSHPLLPVETWIKIFKEEGFEEVFSISPDDLPVRDPEIVPVRTMPQSLIVGRVPLPSHYGCTPG